MPNWASGRQHPSSNKPVFHKIKVRRSSLATGGYMPSNLTLGVVLSLLVASSAAARSQETSRPAQGATGATQDASTDATKKPKRVWTNDDIPASKTAANSNADSKPKTQPGGAKPANAGYVASVKKQLDKYVSQIADIDKQLTDLKNFRDGEPSTGASGVKLDTRYQREPIEVQMRALQDQKKDLLAKMDALLDEARKKGVEPGELR